MVLDAQSKEILDIMICSEPDGAHRSFSYPYLQSLSRWSEEEVSSIVNSLVEKRLADYAYTERERFRYGHVDHFQENTGVRLTQDGRKYKELIHLERTPFRVCFWCFGDCAQRGHNIVARRIANPTRQPTPNQNTQRHPYRGSRFLTGDHPFSLPLPALRRRQGPFLWSGTYHTARILDSSNALATSAARYRFRPLTSTGSIPSD